MQRAWGRGTRLCSACWTRRLSTSSSFTSWWTTFWGPSAWLRAPRSPPSPTMMSAAYSWTGLDPFRPAEDFLLWIFHFLYLLIHFRGCSCVWGGKNLCWSLKLINCKSNQRNALAAAARQIVREQAGLLAAGFYTPTRMSRWSFVL